MARFLRLGMLVPLAMCFALLASLAPSAQAAGSAVAIQGFAFRPASITVPAGSAITWTNQDSAPHTATAKDGSFDTGTLKQGQSMAITFSKAGTYAYYCQFHPFMLGTVTVTAAAAAAPAAVPATAVATQAMQATQTTVAQAATPAAIRPPAPVTRTVQTAGTQAPMPAQMPSTGAGGSTSVWGGVTLGGVIALAIGSLVMARKRA